MYFPSRQEFKKKAKKGNLIPVYSEFLADLGTPVSAFMKINEGEYAYLLESAESDERIGRYSFLGSRPSLVFKSKGRRIEIIKNGKRTNFVTARDPLYEIKRLMRQYRAVNIDGLPRFCGGLVGYMGYDMVRFFERLPDTATDDLDLDESVFVLTDSIIIFDHFSRRIKVVSNAHIEGSADRAYNEAIEKIERMLNKLKKPLPPSQKNGSKKRRKLEVRSNFTKQNFEKMVSRIKGYIKRGDIVQAVLSQRFRMPVLAEGFNVYRALRSINPSPYMFYLRFKDVELIGSSPELLVRCEGRRVETRPIAGTRPRGGNEKEDNLLAKSLLADPKEKAEHIMLVDLGRNDLGRVCEYGSVRTEKLMLIEKYSHVMHITSDVAGKLKGGKDRFDVIRAAFPAGTVSGAPKIRAMEIIDEIEPVKRGPYAGCVGYFSFSGNLDTCITIRTIILKDNMAYVQAGAGIVADSKPEQEYRETVNKAMALFRAIEMAQKELE